MIVTQIHDESDADNDDTDDAKLDAEDPKYHDVTEFKSDKTEYFTGHFE